jgi:hypothetical protein
MKFEIKHRRSGVVLFEMECASLKVCVEAAVKRCADLRFADLISANLRFADLSYANLRFADLSYADLSYADLSFADLRSTNLRSADLSGLILDVPEATDIESVANLDKIREIILANESRLDMRGWHSDDSWKDRSCAEEALCDTVHCIAGFLQACSDDVRVRNLPPPLAGRIMAPVAEQIFYAETKVALEWLRDRKYAEELGMGLPT